jgi:hypothetical protein
MNVTMTAEEFDPEKHLLAYFDRIVLCRYRSRPDLFRVTEDDMGGEIEVITTEESPQPYFRVRFGFRRLRDSRTCLAAFLLDLRSLPASELRVWEVDRLSTRDFALTDSAFVRWSRRYLQGSWESEEGPLRKIEKEIELIQALTKFEVGKALYSRSSNPTLRYPVAENSEAYTLAQVELYRLVIDGLSIDSLKEIAKKLKTLLEENPKTLNSLKKILPADLHNEIHKPLKDCSDIRNKIHGIPSQPAHAVAAFVEFHEQATKIHKAIQRLREWLASEFGLNAEYCRRREEVVSSFTFAGPLRPEFKCAEFAKAEGKTIDRVEMGEIAPGSGCPRREALIFHFTDGTALLIDVGSNVGNFQSSHFPTLDLSEFSSDLMPRWAPNPKELDSE